MIRRHFALSTLLVWAGAPLTFRKPLVYQMKNGTKEMVAGSYRVAEGRVHFALGKGFKQNAMSDAAVQFINGPCASSGGKRRQSWCSSCRAKDIRRLGSERLPQCCSDSHSQLAIRVVLYLARFIERHHRTGLGVKCRPFG